MFTVRIMKIGLLAKSILSRWTTKRNYGHDDTLDLSSFYIKILA